MTLSAFLFFYRRPTSDLCNTTAFLAEQYSVYSWAATLVFSNLGNTEWCSTGYPACPAISFFVFVNFVRLRALDSYAESNRDVIELLSV